MINVPSRAFAGSLALGVALLACPATAQDNPCEIVVFETRVSPPPERAQNAGKPVVSAPSDPRVQELLKLKFDRHPPAILEARAMLAEARVPADKPVELLRVNIVAGRWKEAGAIIGTLPEGERAKVYEHLLKDLDRAAAGNPPGGQQVAGPAPASTLLPAEITEIADAAPANLSEPQLKLLANLLKRSAGSSVSIDPFLERIRSGTAQLGGSDLGRREAAAQLLIEADRYAEAIRFLPPLEQGKETSSFTLLEKHIRILYNLGRQEKRPGDVQKAWELNQTLLAASGCPPELKARGWRRFATIVRFLPPAAATSALKDLFARQPQHGAGALTAVAVQVGDDRSNRDATLRKSNLHLQALAADALTPVLEAHQAEWRPAIDLMALNWMEEAEYSKQRHQPPRNQSMQVDEFGNRIFMGGDQMSLQQQGNSNQLPPIAVQEILEAAPSAAWLSAMDRSLQPRALALLAELNLKLEDDAKALPFIEQLAPIHPKEALRIANELLGTWARTHDPQRSSPRNQSNIVYYGPYGMRQQQGIPLTRALQQRNLEELSAMLVRLRKLPIPPLEDTAVVGAFTAAHSPAEVFREDAIELVLGKSEEMAPKTLAELLQTMRQRLATQWRKPDVQQQAKTQRNDAQITAEISRGYELLSGLITKSVARQPNDWRLNLVQAATWFDWAEFQYGKKVDLEIYVEKRDRAFDAFERATQLYADSLPAEEKDETPLAYQQWLNANLGASDLAMVTRQQEPGAGQLARIREAIAALPPAAAERHFDALAKSVASAESIPGHLKPGYMRAALAVVGDRQASSKIRDLVTYYDGLLRELQLTVQVDGDAAVGHTQPFGVFFTMRHTAEIERENAGGFSKYLRNQTQNTFYNVYGIAPVDHRDELEKQMREKLSEGFEVLSITFHDEKVQSRGYGQAGWRETPLVYLLLKAKDASVDRLPSLRLDVDFLDSQGPVVLPVESAIQLIDARPANPPARPAKEVEITQILDDREWDMDGKLSMEIKATAKGLVPAYSELLDLAPDGFVVHETTDSGIAIQRLDSTGDELTAVSERSWIVKLGVAPSGTRGAAFAFPTPRSADLKVSYKRYQDADLVDAAPTFALAGMSQGLSNVWWWALLGAVVAGPVVFFTARARRAPKFAPEHAYVLPAQVTPFSALQLLRTMQTDAQLALSEEQRRELSRVIGEVEGFYFAHAPNGKQAPDLEGIGREWVSRAQQRRS